MLKIKIRKDSDIPLYKQIIEQITTLVKNRDLRPGDKLPSERELAKMTNIARGTIKKAYMELEKNKVIEAVRGSGSFISGRQNTLDIDRKSSAIRMIDELIENLVQYNFSFREINTLVNIRLLEREKQSSVVYIAAVDCNMEALEIFNKQLSYISKIKIKKILLHEITNIPNAEMLFESFDLILTTSTHYTQLCELIPRQKNKIFQAAVSPSRQTIIDIAMIPANVSIAVLCWSRQFFEIIFRTLESFDIDRNKVFHLQADENMNLHESIQNSQVLIVPPGDQPESLPQYKETIARFIKQGGKMICFDYQIERGSLIYLEEQISSAINKK